MSSSERHIADKEGWLFAPFQFGVCDAIGVASVFGTADGIAAGGKCHLAYHNETGYDWYDRALRTDDAWQDMCLEDFISNGRTL